MTGHGKVRAVTIGNHFAVRGALLAASGQGKPSEPAHCARAVMMTARWPTRTQKRPDADGRWRGDQHSQCGHQPAATGTDVPLQRAPGVDLAAATVAGHDRNV